MTDGQYGGDPRPEGSVVIGEPATEPEPRRPQFSILVVILVALIAGSLVLGLGESGFMTSDDVIADWRSAAAAYDEAAGVVVIFDGEHTWTFDADTVELLAHS
jgi:hypothetical protein